MRALVCNGFGTPDQLIIEERTDLTPGAGQVVVSIRAAGLNFPDVLRIAGKYQDRSEPPFIPGSEAAGVISAVGEGVEDYQVGDTVIVMPEVGAFAEMCVADAHMLTPMPSGLDFLQAAGFTITYGTSYHAFRQSTELKAGETVLVLGAAGGVGSTAIELAKSMGANVIAAASTEEKLNHARSLGADECINYTEESLKDSVKALTGGQGVDVVYDPVGGDLAQQALRATAWQGRFLVIGFAGGAIQKFPANIPLLKEASIIGVFWGSWAARNPEAQNRNMAEMGRMIDNGQIEPRAPEAYPLDQFKAAFDSITGRRAKGKVVLTM
jgi:NADPH2:quinone reductase